MLRIVSSPPAAAVARTWLSPGESGRFVCGATVSERRVAIIEDEAGDYGCHNPPQDDGLVRAWGLIFCSPNGVILQNTVTHDGQDNYRTCPHCRNPYIDIGCTMNPNMVGFSHTGLPGASVMAGGKVIDEDDEGEGEDPEGDGKTQTKEPEGDSDGPLAKRPRQQAC